MKFNCDARAERRDAEIARLKEWHPYFAWFPVRIGYGDCRWMERVERRLDYIVDWSGSYYWEYRNASR